MENGKVQILMKILTEKEHCENMLNGNILFKPIEVFNGIDDNHVRGDKYDGQEYILDPKNTSVMIDNIPITGVTGKILIKNQYVSQHTKICSLYLLEAYTNKAVIYDERIFSFGDFCVVITEPNKFIDRVKRQVDTMYPSTFRCKPIKYENMGTVDGAFGLFKKPYSYCWQNEFRMCFVSSNTDNEFINMGSISDIAKIYKLDDFLQHFSRK